MADPLPYQRFIGNGTDEQRSAKIEAAMKMRMMIRRCLKRMTRDDAGWTLMWRFVQTCINKLKLPVIWVRLRLGNLLLIPMTCWKYLTWPMQAFPSEWWRRMWREKRRFSHTMLLRSILWRGFIPTTISKPIVNQAAVVMSIPTTSMLPKHVELASFYMYFMSVRT